MTVGHGCWRFLMITKFDPGLRWYEANKHRTPSESPAALGPRGPAWQWEHSVLLPADGGVSVRQLTRPGTWLGQYSHAQPVAQTRGSTLDMPHGPSPTGRPRRPGIMGMADSEFLSESCAQSAPKFRFCVPCRTDLAAPWRIAPRLLVARMLAPACAHTCEAASLRPPTPTAGASDSESLRR